MNKEKADRIIRLCNWMRFIILALFLILGFIGLGKAACFIQ